MFFYERLSILKKMTKKQSNIGISSCNNTSCKSIFCINDEIKNELCQQILLKSHLLQNPLADELILLFLVNFVIFNSFFKIDKEFGLNQCSIFGIPIKYTDGSMSIDNFDFQEKVICKTYNTFDITLSQFINNISLLFTTNYVNFLFKYIF